MKKFMVKIVLLALAIFVLITGINAFGYNIMNNNVLILQFGQIVDVKTEPGIYFKNPFIQSTKDIFVGEQLYDLPSTEVITSDKKTMIADCYVTWRITDPKVYYQTVSSENVAQDRINVAVYNALKNVVSFTTQD